MPETSLTQRLLPERFSLDGQVVSPGRLAIAGVADVATEDRGEILPLFFYCLDGQPRLDSHFRSTPLGEERTYYRTTRGGALVQDRGSVVVTTYHHRRTLLKDTEGVGVFMLPKPLCVRPEVARVVLGCLELRLTSV